MRNMHYIGVLVFTVLCLSSAYASECVQVKGRGKVPLSEMRCETVSGFNLVDTICYDEKNGYLIVSLPDQYYEYCGVQPQYVNEFLKAPEKGAYLNTHIANGVFDCTIFQPPAYAGQCK